MPKVQLELFPSFEKIGFVNYDDTFRANECFTELGILFVLACRAINNVSDKTPHKDIVLERLVNIKQCAQKQGLVEMYLNKEYENHNMWVALKLLKAFTIINWNYFLYALHCLEIGFSLDDAIEEIKKVKDQIDTITFVNEEGENCLILVTLILEAFRGSWYYKKVGSKESALVNPSDKIFTIITL